MVHRFVARAWQEPEFRRWLLEDATAAIASLGFGGRQGEHMVAVENTPEVHNMVVCTLCSCYPWSVLGLPPTWYKSAPYRARAPSRIRAACSENSALNCRRRPTSAFGIRRPKYATSCCRSARPGTERLSEAELANLVTAATP